MQKTSNKFKIIGEKIDNTDKSKEKEKGKKNKNYKIK